MSFTNKNSLYAHRQAERAAEQKSRDGDPYLERQARREAVPPSKRQPRQVVPYLERQAARAADKVVATRPAEDRKSDR